MANHPISGGFLGILPTSMHLLRTQAQDVDVNVQVKRIESAKVIHFSNEVEKPQVFWKIDLSHEGNTYFKYVHFLILQCLCATNLWQNSFIVEHNHDNLFYWHLERYFFFY